MQENGNDEPAAENTVNLYWPIDKEAHRRELALGCLLWGVIFDAIVGIVAAVIWFFFFR